LVHRVRSQGWLVKDAAEAAGVSRRTAHKWLKRFEEAGEAGLLDRSSRPLSSPRRIAARIVRAIARLRHRCKTAWEIACELRMARSTVSRILSRLGLGRLWRVLEAADPPQRYEHEQPGGLVGPVWTWNRFVRVLGSYVYAHPTRSDEGDAHILQLRLELEF